MKQVGLTIARGINPLLWLMPLSHFSPDAVYILMMKPLGIGDVVMLSPLVADIASMGRGVRVQLVTEYSAFMDIPGAGWIHPDCLTQAKLRDALVVSPTLSWRHARFLLNAGFHLGYFLSDRLMCNFVQVSGGYDARYGHYFDRTGPVLAVLKKIWGAPVATVSYPSLRMEPVEHFGLPDSYVCIAPYSNWDERQYPVARWVDIVSRLCKRITVVLVGGDGAAEQLIAAHLEQTGVLNLVGKTKLGQLASIIAGSQVFVGNDSGPSHMAFLVAKGSVAIFGCVGGTQRIPLDPATAGKITLLGNGFACGYFPCYDGFSKPKCRNREKYLCMDSVPPSLVVDSVFSMMNGQA